MRIKALLAAALATTLLSAPLLARDPVTPEQRIGRLEKQLRQVQKTVFPKGQPADSAGFDDAPAATQDSVTSLTARLDAVERQMADLVRSSEENGNRLATLEAAVARQGADSDRRLRAVENGPAAPAGDEAASVSDPGDMIAAAPDKPLVSRPKVEGKTPKGAATRPSTPLTGDAAGDPAEVAYQKGYELWNAGKYDAAVTALKAVAIKYPTHKRASWARNLAGRALYDKGDYRAAAETLLANYRTDGKGERAPDSLFYLGQSVIKLGQPGQACKAYAELDTVYGAGLRPQLKALLPKAKAEAGCN